MQADTSDDQPTQVFRRKPGPLAFALKFLAWTVGGGLALLVIGACLLGIALAMAYPNLPEVNAVTDYRPKLPMHIYSADGKLLGEFGDERRTYRSIDEIPKVMQGAVLAIEDSRFYEHNGVDYVGVLRAGLENFREAKSQGASTITMQLARNFYLPSEKTFARKIYEILLALKIERALSKPKILEVYMNQIYLGQRAYGFAAASEVYFGKPLQDISAGEAAMLAGLPKAPSAYNPIVNPTRAERRQQHILDRMLETGVITAAEHQVAKSTPLKYRQGAATNPHAAYSRDIAEVARQMIFAQYGEDTYTRGLRVTLSVDSRDQAAAYKALRRGILNFERRQNYRGPEAYIKLPEDDKNFDVKIAETLEEHPDYDDLRAAVVLSAKPQEVRAMLQDGQIITLSGNGLRSAAAMLRDPSRFKTPMRPGAVIRVLDSGKNEWSIVNRPEVQGALVALDPKTGLIRAMIGGFDYSQSKYNHVTQAWRQPGSSFKPFIYSAALEKHFGPATVVNDAPLFFDAGTTGSQPWEPKNYDGHFDGPMSLRRGLARSKNMVSIRVLQAIKPEYAQEWVTHFGFEAQRHPPYLTMALGAGSVTPLQVASGYAVFANGGFRVNPGLILKVADSRGQLLSQALTPELDESQRAIPSRNAFLMSSLLQEVTRSGTAAQASKALHRSDVFGKTGTTNDAMDAWFAGYQPSLVAVVWMGYDQPRKLGDRETGGGLALPIWIDYMSQALRGVKTQEYPPPEGVTNIGGEWYYTEDSAGAAVRSLGLEARLPNQTKKTSEDERQTILDLFKDDGEAAPPPPAAEPSR